MSNTPASTIAVLCYKDPQQVDFRSIVGALKTSLDGGPLGACAVRSDYSDFVTFELEDTRICLAHCDLKTGGTPSHSDHDDPQLFASSLVLSVGSHPAPWNDGLPIKARQSLCEGLLDCIEDVHPGDHFFWVEVQDAFDADLYDLILEQIWPSLAMGADVPAEIPDHRTPPETLLPALEERLDEELRRKDATRSNDPVAEPVSQTCPPPQSEANLHEARKAQSQHLARVQSMLTPPPNVPTCPITGGPQASSIPHRVTQFSRDATTLAMSLPVGMAAMSYMTLERDHLPYAARAVAITGSAIGVGQSGVVPTLMNIFL
ncbi:hypothetical protein [Aestuariibius sp. HNIBRBA575]|uniref:hypothetical protein n=1 Tax=Aestuariibius sp. HNIBRBA575 TaxID=3233343 RepID=UPI0034A5CBEC